MLIERLRVRAKLAILAGVPVVGAMVLSIIVIEGARRSARTAEAIGSIEDLAELSERMRDTVSSLQAERARTAWATGENQEVEAATRTERSTTDSSLDRLNAFVSSRDRSALPPKLARELNAALAELQRLPQFRLEFAKGSVPLDEQLKFYSAPTTSLVGATAALNELSDDGDLLRSISSLASAMEVKERQSLQHALLAHVFGRKEFPPGSFRRLVTLNTEEQVYAASFARSASEVNRAALDRVKDGPSATVAASLRQQALESTEELTIDSQKWYTVQSELITELGGIEKDLGGQVRQAAVVKLNEARHAVRLGVGLTASVLIVSLLLAVIIARGIGRSVASLYGAAERVRANQDYSVRAQRLTQDEIGGLTDLFNEMLAGIQARDLQLAQHSDELERLVAARTSELMVRNAAMRVVLDNVAQGLATAGVDGKLSPEYSAAFKRWFGAPASDVTFGDHLAGENHRLQATFQVAFEQVVEEVIPPEVSLAMMPSRMERDGRFYSFEYAPLWQDDKLSGVLLMISDISSQIQAEKFEVEQQERVKTFQRVLKDRAGFVEFFAEARSLVGLIRDDKFADDSERRRVVHTLKGNASLYDVVTVVSAVHDLEQAFDEADVDKIRESRELLVEVWDAYATRAVALLGEDVGDRIELSKAELDGLLVLVRNGASKTELERRISRLAFEPMQVRLQRLKEQLVGLANRLRKPIPQVSIDGSDVRLPAALLAPLWASFAHLIRNIVDHGLDDPEARERAGKLSQPSVAFSVKETEKDVTIVVQDDGRGIDWEQVRQRARARNLRHMTQQDLVAALLSAGFSTAQTVTATSGRGVGLSAVFTAVTELGGQLIIDSVLGKGTRFVISLPASRLKAECESPRLSNRPLSTAPAKSNSHSSTTNT